MSKILSNPTTLSAGILITSLALIVTTIVNAYKILQGLWDQNSWYPEHLYKWWQIQKGVWVNTENPVTMSYDFSADHVIVMATGLSLLVGFIGVVRSWESRKWTKLVAVWTYIALVFSSVSFFTSLVTLIWTSSKQDAMKKSTCNPADGIKKEHFFTCSRELAACTMYQHLDAVGFIDYGAACHEAKSARLMLVVFIMLQLVLVGLFAGRMWVLRKTGRFGQDAEERLEKLRQVDE